MPKPFSLRLTRLRRKKKNTWPVILDVCKEREIEFCWASMFSLMTDFFYEDVREWSEGNYGKDAIYFYALIPEDESHSG